MIRNGRPSRDRGAIAVEFALVFPVLLAVLFGLIQYGLYFWSMQGGSAAAREAARQAAVGKLSDCGQFRSFVEDRLGATDSNQSAAQITRSYERLSASTPPEWNEFTPSAADPVMVGDLVTVTLKFQSYDMNFPFVPFIDGGVVSQAADTRVEYVPDEAIGTCP